MGIALWLRQRRILTRPLPTRLRSWLLASHLALVVVCLGGLGLWTGQHLQATSIAQNEQQLRLQSVLIATALRDPLLQTAPGGADGELLANQAQEYAASTGIRVTVLDTHLHMLASSDEQTPPAETAQAPEVLAARDGHARAVFRRDAQRGEERLFIAAPVRYQERVLGYVQCSVPAAPIRAAVARHWLGLLVVELGILVAAVLVSLTLAWRIAAPVQRLSASVSAIAAGHVEQRVTPAGPDEVRQLGQAFNRMAEQIELMLTRQQAFVADAAHELRSPLTGIRLRLELLRAHPHDDELSRRYLGQLAREVDQLGRLVDELLTLSALDEGQHRPWSAVDLAPLLYDLADEISPLVHAANLDLHVDIPAHLPPLAADPEQLRLVARNLLDNAIKYTPAGGAITLSAASGAGEVRIIVADTGIGVAPESLPYVFERFYRADKARVRGRGGVGLGLALVRAVVQTHGGAVEVRSAVGAGSAFLVRLPVISQTVTAPAPGCRSSQDTPQTNSTRIAVP